MKLKPTVAILAVALAGPALAAYGPSHAGGSSCAAPAMSSNMSGNSVMSSGDFSKCWYNRIHVGGSAVLAAARTNVEDGTNNTDEDASDVHLSSLNVNLSTDVSKDVSAFVNVHYGDNDFFNDLYQSRANGGSGVAITGPAAYTVNSLDVDEAYVTFKNVMDTGAYMKVGQMYTDFGNYSDPFTALPSLTQVMIQSNHPTVTLGYADNGMYGSVYAYRGNLDGTSGNNGFNQYGFKAGYANKVNDINYDVNFSWQNDARTMYEHGARNNPGLKRYFMDNLNDTSTFNLRQDVWNLHADFDYQDVAVNFDFTDVDNNLSSTASTAPRILGLGATYNFELSSMKSDVHGRWESVADGNNVMAYDTAWSVGFTTELDKNVSAGLDYAYYDGVMGTNGAFAGEPDHASSLMANVRVSL